MSRDFSEKLDSFMVDNGVIWGPEPEIYGGLSGFHTYGPLGKLLKRKIEDMVRSELEKEDFFEIEAPSIAPKEVWEASGHLETFVDPMITCEKCDSDFRADKLLEDEDVIADSLSYQELGSMIADKGIRCPKCGSQQWGDINPYNLMVETEIGKNNVAYNRPETATTSYLPFNHLYYFFRKKLPMKIFQIGKAWRNEISPRKGVVRGREFTQAEAQMLLTEADLTNFDLDDFAGLSAKFLPELFQEEGREAEEMGVKDLLNEGFIDNKAFGYSLFLALRVFNKLKIPQDRIRIRQHSSQERAHYASDAWDFEVKTDTVGWIECCGVHDRGTYDLKRHSQRSHMELKVNHDGESVYPRVLEIAFGIDRPLYALLDAYYEEDERKLFKVPRQLAPIQVGVFPLVAKDGLPQIAEDIYQDLKQYGWKAIKDDTGSIGKRYRRIDEKGVPLGITVDYDTKEDGTVTLRDRDSMEQVRVPISELNAAITDFICRGEQFEALGEEV